MVADPLLLLKIPFTPVLRGPTELLHLLSRCQPAKYRLAANASLPPSTAARPQDTPEIFRQI